MFPALACSQYRSGFLSDTTALMETFWGAGSVVFMGDDGQLDANTMYFTYDVQLLDITKAAMKLPLITVMPAYTLGSVAGYSQWIAKYGIQAVISCDTSAPAAMLTFVHLTDAGMHAYPSK